MWYLMVYSHQLQRHQARSLQWVLFLAAVSTAGLEFHQGMVHFPENFQRRIIYNCGNIYVPVMHYLFALMLY
jgi:hypothetical protein